MANKTDQFFVAGAGRVDITPAPGTLINGDFFPHRATHIHDPLFAKALFMRDRAASLVMVVVDTCVMSLEYSRQLRLLVEKETGIPFGNILISTTHTHAAGSLSEVYLCGPDPAYSALLPGKIIDAVRQAMQKAKPARLAFGSVMVPEHVLCRRYIMKPGSFGINPVNGCKEEVVTNPFGAEDGILRNAAGTDPEVGYIALQDTAGNWICILANYSLHYVGDWEHGTISSDYFGEFEQQLKARLPVDENFTAIMSNGTSGDVNCWDFLQPHRYPAVPFQKSKMIAGDIAERLTNSLGKLQWDENPALSIRYIELDLRLRKPAPGELAAARQLMQQTDYENLLMNDDGLRRMYAREQVLLNDCPDTVRYPLQAFRIGKGIIGGMAGEIFAETGLRIKAAKPATCYFTICLANGNAGYVPPAHEIELGGYETWRCRYSCLENEAEKIIRQQFLQLLKDF